MGKKKGERYYEAEAIVVKKIEGGEIIFYDKDTIYLYPDGSPFGTVFRKWLVPKGYYSENWKPFRDKLWKSKRLTIRRCYELSLKHEILAMSSYTRLNLEGKKVRTVYGAKNN